MPPSLPTPEILTVYGADWCGDCRTTRLFLDGKGVAYRYVDLATDPLARDLLDAAGYRAIPVVVTPEGRVMIEPSMLELDRVVTTATGQGSIAGRPLEPPARMERVPQYDVELILARQLADGLAVPVLLVDERGDTVFFNEPAELLFGRRFDEVDALTFDDRTAVLAPRHEDGRLLAAVDLPGMRAMRERRPAHAAFHMHGLDGVLRPIEATAIPLESARGHVLGAFVVLWAQDHVDPSPEGAG
jgi:glutaredoxin